ncbi:hypothetical protein CIPAW_02G143400 [Carya illinoinensis]|uniref:Protein kinase domain-containing protein n=1 Tax=Carya illinoinensis TaxID=32201 RepID=A0A8T1RFS6_CARIL|nr:hypothetical protein CIPAW_02G143400 [Carya illinoinensis]
MHLSLSLSLSLSVRILGFISLDCGLPENSSYSDPTTDIYYISDASCVSTGAIMSVSTEFRTNEVRKQLWNVRSFPDGDRNCYYIRLTAGVRYLIRGTFMYGNYDAKGELPVFDLHIGPNKWDSLKFESASAVIYKEIIHVPSSSYIHVCLLNTDSGTPFISALELRPLRNNTYVSESGSLALVARADTDLLRLRKLFYKRYKDDKFDRIGSAESFSVWTSLSTPLIVNAGQNTYEPPSVVMSTAATTKDANTSLDFYWDVPPNDNSGYYIYMHFAEVEELKANQYRAFNVNLNGNFWYGPVVPYYLYDFTVYSQSALTGGRYNFSLTRTENSTLPPIINAVEIYEVIQLLQTETDQEDVDAIINTKLMYGVTRNWQGDPCFPQAYMWNGLECSSGSGYNNTPRITSLNLSSSGLTGGIAPYISNLTMLVSLDLSNNSLTGSVPDFLSQLPSLSILKLEKNKLTGSVPVQLVEKSKNGALLLSVDPNLCSSASCKKKKSIAVIAAVASVAGLVIVLLLTTAAIFWSLKRRKRKGIPKIDAETNNQNRLMRSEMRQFTYSDILNITDNLQRTLGKGGFGTVYHGYMDGTEVAVKMLSPSSAQGYREFEAEVKLLTRVHHRNLTTFFGYCHEEAHMGLIYEFMACGNLQDRNTNTPISWDDRLRILLEAAQGLEYLHNGCRPPIIHRDVKPTNILLNENLQAKLADFGLSKVLPSTDGASHVSTIVAGTFGYLDPEYGTSNRLTEKSDVYSFGVVMLEIITGRPVIARNPEKTHVSTWVSFMLAKGDIKNIVDPRLRGDFHVGSAWKAVEIAMNCVSPTSARRPVMSQVATGLTECVSIAGTEGYESESRDSIPLMINLNLTTNVNPVAR